MAITQTRTNTTTTRQPRNRHHEEVHVETRLTYPQWVRRLQMQVSDMCRHHAKEVMALWQENAQL